MKAAGITNHSVVDQLLDEYDGSSEISPEEELHMKHFAGTFYNGELKLIDVSCELLIYLCEISWDRYGWPKLITWQEQYTEHRLIESDRNCTADIFLDDAPQPRHTKTRPGRN